MSFTSRQKPEITQVADCASRNMMLWNLFICLFLCFGENMPYTHILCTTEVSKTKCNSER